MLQVGFLATQWILQVILIEIKENLADSLVITFSVREQMLP